MPDEPSKDAASPEGRVAALQTLQARLTALLPELDAARQAYFAAPSPETEARADEVQDAASALLRELEAEGDRLAAELGVDPNDFERAPWGDGVDRRPRASLTEDQLEPTAEIDALLPFAYEAVMRLLPSGWVEAGEPPVGLEALLEPDAVLSLVKGLRPESEFGPVHRFRQAMRLVRDRIDGAPAFDHFAGAGLVPTIFQLGTQLETLAEVGGDRDARVARLHAGPSLEVDSTLFEVLVAIRCAGMGRSVEFLKEDPGRKTPDLQCHDPYPMVIECKRQRAFLDYELDEDQAMRALFRRLRQEACRLCVYGAFELRLEIEASRLPVEDVVAALVGQRFAPDPRRPVRHPFGTVSLATVPGRASLNRAHRLYSPDMLEELFGWTSDFPAWDGLVCSVADPALVMDVVREPVGLLWTNESDKAVNKRTWTAQSLFGDATGQVPPGGFGMVYVAYTEGARETMADRRLERFVSSLEDWTHDANIRIPMVNINRLYPRPLGDGRPDLIESSVRLLAAYSDAEAFQMFPATAFTRQDV